MKAPTCPKDNLHPTLHPWHSTKVEAKRSLEVEAYLFRRDEQCTNDLWSRLIQYSAVLFGHTSTNMTALQNLWDNEFANSYDTQITYSTLSQYFKDRPSIDRTAALEWIFYDPVQAGPGLRLSIGMESKLCYSGTTSKRNLVDGIYENTARAINAWGTPSRDTDHPSWERILGGIEAGALQLHYARWQHQTGESTGQDPGYVKKKYMLDEHKVS
jgi:chitinase